MTIGLHLSDTMTMSLLKLVFCVCCCFMSVRCLEQNQLVAWSSVEYRSLHSMLLTSDGAHLFVADKRYVYHISPEDLAIKNGDMCRAAQIIYDKTEHYLFLCCKELSICYQWLYRSKDFEALSGPSININGVKAFLVTYAKPDDRKPNDNFLFIGCPHVEGQEKLGGRCTKPGIAWYLNHEKDKRLPWFGFKSFDKTPVLTDKFIDALTVDNFRLFFSKQTVKATGRRRSQIAQVCQHFVQRDNYYSTPFTYADMQVQCGQLNEIKAVKEVVVGTETLFVIAFSENSISAVCVFTMENVKKMFVENIKDCYRGIRVSEKEDYIDFQQSSIPCKTAIADNETFRKPDDYFLCNKDNLELYHHVIGTKILTSQPVLQYDVQLTAVTVSVVDSKVVAFFGTATRTILKAVVYPTASAVSIKQPVIRKVGHTILQDMYTSKDQKHIFVLTTKQVLKVPVESCRYFSSCEDCVTDPLCAWCVVKRSLEMGCVSKDLCISPGRSVQQCPRLGRIVPPVISYKNFNKIRVDLYSLKTTPLFGIITFRYENIVKEVPSRATSSGSSLICTPDSTTIQSMQSSVKGFLNVTVSVRLGIANAPPLSGYFIIYQCNSIDRCSDCTNTAWKCKWCQYTNQSMCIDSDESCNPSGIAVEADDCPRVTNYKIVSDGGSVRDPSGMVYLSRRRNYEINIKVTNVSKSRSVFYKCKIESHTQTLWLNSSQFNENGSVTCKITKEEMTTLPYSVSRLKGALQLVAGVSPIDGDKMPMIIYACENLVQPSENCGQCKSFAKYQPYLLCSWNGTHCSDRGITNDTAECGYPEINKVHPLSAYAKATTVVEIGGFNLGSSYNDTVNAVSIAGKSCASIPSLYEPGVKIWCELAPESSVTEKNGTVAVTLANNSTGQYSELFYHLVPVVTSIEPAFGPMSGGTSVSINGKHLNTGTKATVRIGPKECVLTTRNLRQIICKTKDMFLNEPTPSEVVVEIDGARVLGNMSLKYNYSEDPFIKKIHPLTSFASGGRTLIVEGTNLHVVGIPKIYAVVAVDPLLYRYLEIKSEMKTCTKVGQPGSTTLNCPSPKFSNEIEDELTEDGTPGRLAFEMDDVLSVTAYNLPSNIATIQYFPDPVLTTFTEDLVYNGGRIAIKGELNRHVLDKDDVNVYIGCEVCTDILASVEGIGCEPPVNKPVCWKRGKQPLPIDVKIGYFRQRVGFLAYKEDTTTQSIATDAEIATAIFKTSDDPNNMITVVIVLVVLVVAAITAIGVIILVFYRKYGNRRGGELNTPVVYRRNETAESNVNRNTSAVSHISRRATTVIYDDIADGDIVNEYLELSGEDPTYTEADVYIDPYHKTDFTIDQSAIINDTPSSDDPENMHLQPLVKSSRSGVPGIQENVDELQNDTNDGKVNPAESQEGFKDATEESESTEKDDWQIDDCTPNADGGYIHPVWSQESRESKCENMLETPRSSYVGKSMETSDEVLASGQDDWQIDDCTPNVDGGYIHPVWSGELQESRCENMLQTPRSSYVGKSLETSDEGLASGQGHTVDNDDGFINPSGGQEKDLELAKHGETSASADIMYKEKEEETTLE